MEIGAGGIVFLSVMIMSSASLALLGSRFSNGKWLEHITLIDLSKHDLRSIARISSTMMYSIALSFSAAAMLAFWTNILIASYIVLAATVAVCLIGYICMARAPRLMEG